MGFHGAWGAWTLMIRVTLGKQTLQNQEFSAGANTGAAMPPSEQSWVD